MKFANNAYLSTFPSHEKKGEPNLSSHLSGNPVKDNRCEG